MNNLGIPTKFFTLLPTQCSCIKQGVQCLQAHGLVYFAMQERTGKTLTSLVSACLFKPKARIIIYTKKRALQGWQEWIQNPFFKNLEITLLNYESNAKLEGRFDIVILDEAHNYISKYPRPSMTYKKISKVTKDAHVIYCSATPCAEGYSKLFYQLHLCSYSPFKQYKNFYQWFKEYGIRQERIINGLRIVDYSKTKDQAVKQAIEPFFITAKRDFNYEPMDVVVELDYTQEQKDLIKKILKGGIVEHRGFVKTIDTKISEVLALWQVEGGSLICDNGVLTIPTNKTEYIHDKNSVVFCYFKHEVELLSQYESPVYHYTKHSEGIDLSMYDQAVIYTPTFSATKYSQVRSRLSRYDRDRPITILWLNNGKKSVCAHIYNAVVQKNTKFTLQLFTQSREYLALTKDLLKC